MLDAISRAVHFIKMILELICFAGLASDGGVNRRVFWVVAIEGVWGVYTLQR